MNLQLRQRLLVLWLILSGLFLVVFYLRWSDSPKLPLWTGRKATVEESKPNAAIVMLLPPSRVTEAVMTLLNIEDRFNRRLKYPYVLLTEGTISDEIQRKVDWITEGRATFADLPPNMWGAPEFLDKDKIDHSLNTIGFSLGYRSMCRFFSGFFWRHPAIAQYDWIWRLDTDIVFHCDVPYDPFVRMRSSQALYGFVQIVGDAASVQPSLAGNVSAFLSNYSDRIPPGVNHPFSWKDVRKALRGEAGTDDWTVRVFYNNWEISHRSLWSSDIYTSLFEYLDRSGGFFYERWGDAVVHSYGVSMALRVDQVIQFDDMGYQHQGWPYECPELDRCACARDTPASQHFNSRANQWFNAGGDRRVATPKPIS